MVGYAATDRLVAEAGRRLASIASPHLVARIGEDEFALLAHGPDDDAAAEELARKVHQALNFDFSGVAVRCAVGFARHPRDANGLEALMLAAEGSLLSAKAAIGERLAGPSERI
jgi:predicted signal transduction protein with EAL and GGDEF domain